MNKTTEILSITTGEANRSLRLTGLRDTKFTMSVNRDILFEAVYEPVQADQEPQGPGTTAAKHRD